VGKKLGRHVTHINRPSMRCIHRILQDIAAPVSVK